MGNVDRNLSLIEKLFAEYQAAINRIDDYFEYSHKSEVDKKYVMGVIDKLNGKILEINDEHQMQVLADRGEDSTGVDNDPGTEGDVA